jgi:hypothetical protein
MLDAQRIVNIDITFIADGWHDIPSHGTRSTRRETICCRTIGPAHHLHPPVTFRVLPHCGNRLSLSRNRNRNIQGCMG